MDLRIGAARYPHGCLPGEGLPALDDHIAVRRINLQREAGPSHGLRSDQRGAGPAERLVDCVAPLAVVDDRATHDLGRLLRAVRRRAVFCANWCSRPDGRLVPRSLPMAWATTAHCVPARLMLPVVVTASERKAAL